MYPVSSRPSYCKTRWTLSEGQDYIYLSLVIWWISEKILKNLRIYVHHNSLVLYLHKTHVTLVRWWRLPIELHSTGWKSVAVAPSALQLEKKSKNFKETFTTCVQIDSKKNIYIWTAVLVTCDDNYDWWYPNKLRQFLSFERKKLFIWIK